MTRKFLEEKDLSKELVDEILDENSKDISILLVTLKNFHKRRQTIIILQILS